MSDDRENRHRRSGRPLLSLAAADEPLSAGVGDPSLAGAHRRARARRTAAPSPLIEALARAPESVDQSFRGRPGIADPGPGPAENITPPPGRPSAWPMGDADPAFYAVAPEPARRHPVASVPAGSDTPERLWQPLIDVETVIRAVIKARWLIAGTTLAGAVIAAMIAVSTPHTYTAYTQVLVDPREVKVVGKDLTPGYLANEAVLAMIDSQVQVLRSTSVLRQVVDRTSLTKDPEFNGEASGGLSSLTAPIRALFSLVGGAPDDPTAKTIENLRDSIWVNRANRTFVLDIAVTTENPDKSALLANELTRVFMEVQGTQSTSLAAQATEALTGRLEELRKAVEADEQAVEEYKAANGLIGVQGRLTDEDDLIALNAQLSKARGETLAAKVRAEAARSAGVDQILSGNLPENLTSPQLSELRTQYVQLKQEADVVGRSYGPRHPRNIDAQAKVTAARDEIQAELRRIAQTAQAAYRSAVQTEQELAQGLAALKVRQVTNGEALVELRELQRKADASRAVYESFLLSARETGELKDISTSNMRVISEAEPPMKPSSPSRKLTVLAGAGAGFALGFGLAALAGVWQSISGRTGPSGPRRRPAERASEPGAGAPARPPWLPFLRPGGATSEAGSLHDQDHPHPETDMHNGRNPAPYPYGPAPVYPTPQQQQAAYPAGWPGAAVQPHWAQPPFPGPAAPAWQQGPAPQPWPQPDPYQHWQAMAQPVPPQPPYQGWAQAPAPQPAPAWPSAQVQQPWPYAAPHAVQPAPAMPEPSHPAWRGPQRQALHADPAEDDALDDLRQSLREVRDAVEALAGRRQRRRFG